MIYNQYFDTFRKKIIGNDIEVQTDYGFLKLKYADWAASGRLYKDIENKITYNYGLFYSNLHSTNSILGKITENFYLETKEKIRSFMRLDNSYTILSIGSGMTSAIDRLQIILGLKNDKIKAQNTVVFITKYEHNSNYLSWIELGAQICIIENDSFGMPSADYLESQLKKCQKGTNIIGSFTSCSNVTGIRIDYIELTQLVKNYGGLCFVDYTANAPYDDIAVGCSSEKHCVDAIFFSPHKFIGGPGSAGVLVFKNEIYKIEVPTIAGGGTVLWSSPWSNFIYNSNIEIKEEAGTPPILQTFKSGLAVELRNEMGLEYISKRENEIVKFVINELRTNDNIDLYSQDNMDRICVFSFNFKNLHHSRAVYLLGHKYGIQVRGGCSCASILAHELLKINKEQSVEYYKQIQSKLDLKLPGWVRISLNPVMSDESIFYILDAISELSKVN